MNFLIDFIKALQISVSKIISALHIVSVFNLSYEMAINDLLQIFRVEVTFLSLKTSLIFMFAGSLWVSQYS